MRMVLQVNSKLQRVSDVHTV